LPCPLSGTVMTLPDHPFLIDKEELYMLIRPEGPADLAAIHDLVQAAFASAEHSDGTEQDLVDALRRGPAFIPELSLVAEEDGTLLGHILFTKMKVGDREALASCYRSCLALAADRGCESVAFCCISTGEFRFPNREAAEVAVETVRDFLNGAGRTLRVIFDVFKDRDLEIYRELLGE